MSNYKIRVNSKSESKEAQQLFFELGYNWFKKGYVEVKTPETIMSFENGALSTGIRGSINHKEITLPELRDLVVLKRNDVGDATNTDGRYSFYVGKDKNYFFSSCDKAWRGTWKNVEILKPIEKPMKEYLRKNNDGEYILEVTDEREAQEPHAKHWIEVPKGCDYLISVFGVNSFIDSDMFAKFKTKNVLWSRKPMKEYIRKNSNGTYSYIGTVRPEHVSDFMIEIPEGATYYAKDASLGKNGNFFFRLRSDDFDFEAVWLESNWIQAIFNVENQDVLWQRHTIPEELPFIDDECYTNKSDGVFRLPISEPCDISNWVEIREEGSLNDQYAEIEKVRQSHRTASERADPTIKETLNQRQSQYGSFEDVAMITEQMVDVMRKGYYENLAYNQKMALYMICSKMARIVNGNPNHKDSWHDIAGYATLIDNELVSEKDMPF